MASPVAIQASAGTDAMSEAIIASTVPKGAVITEQPVLGDVDKPEPVIAEPEKPKFFPANPSLTEKLAENKPVKGLVKEGSGSGGSGIFRTISDVLVELRGKHQDKKRARQQSAQDAAASEAKVRKETGESPAKSPAERQPSSPLKSFFSVGSPKRTASGTDPNDDKVRTACWSPTASQAAKGEKKPSLAQRYSAWKVNQSEKKKAQTSQGSAKKDAAASTKGSVAVSSDATAAKTAAVASPSAAATTEPVVVSSDATPAEAAEVVSKDAVHGQST